MELVIIMFLWTSGITPLWVNITSSIILSVIILTRVIKDLRSL